MLRLQHTLPVYLLIAVFCTPQCATGVGIFARFGSTLRTSYLGPDDRLSSVLEDVAELKRLAESDSPTSFRYTEFANSRTESSKGTASDLAFEHEVTVTKQGGRLAKHIVDQEVYDGIAEADEAVAEAGSSQSIKSQISEFEADDNIANADEALAEVDEDDEDDEDDKTSPMIFRNAVPDVIASEALEKALLVDKEAHTMAEPTWSGSKPIIEAADFIKQAKENHDIKEVLTAVKKATKQHKKKHIEVPVDDTNDYINLFTNDKKKSEEDFGSGNEDNIETRAKTHAKDTDDDVLEKVENRHIRNMVERDIMEPIKDLSLVAAAEAAGIIPDEQPTTSIVPSVPGVPHHWTLQQGDS